MEKIKKDILSNKKTRFFLTAITLLLVTIGSTYAWWTASTQVEQKVTMRNLAIEASFAPQDHTNYEPGTYAKIE